MKQKLLTLLLLLLCVGQSWGIHYKFNDSNKTASVVNSSDPYDYDDGQPYSDDITILSNINGYTVTTIGYQAFLDCKSILSFFIPNTVTSIEPKAFYGCTGITSINLPEALTTIESETFSGCSSLTSITIPKSVTSIGPNAFSTCSKITSIKLPEAVVNIEHGAFWRCTSLTSVNIPKAVTAIRPNTFAYCSNITSINIPEGVTSIGNYAFQDCHLVSVIIPCSVLEIGDHAFHGTQSISIPNTVVKGGGFLDEHTKEVKIICKDEEDFSKYLTRNDISDIFYSTNSKRSIYINGVKQTQITIDSTIKNIGDYALACCDITQVVIPVDCSAKIGRNVFLNCNSLDEIRIESKQFISIEDISFNTNRSVVIVPATFLFNYHNNDVWKNAYKNIVPDNARLSLEAEVSAERDGSNVFTKLGEEALSYATNLKLKGSLNGYDFMIFRNRMPNLHHLDLTETEIVGNPYEYETGCYTENERLGKRAFADNQRLVSIKLPNSIRYIGVEAFKGCANLETVTFYPGIVTIDDQAFYKSGVKSISIPDVKVINNEVFKNCPNLMMVDLGKEILSIGKEGFCNCPFASITLPSSLTSLGDGVFYSCSNLSEIVLSQNLTEIPYEAFLFCSKLKDIVIPAKLKKIGGKAFGYCTNLVTLRIPPMTQEIGGSAFYDCPNIKDVYTYIANAKDIRIDQNTFPCWATATLHVPNFAKNSYYWDTQWSQFYQITEFEEDYSTFYTANTMILDDSTGTIGGTPDGSLYGTGGLIVDGVDQGLDTVELNADGSNGATIIPTGGGTITANNATIVIKVTADKWHFFSFPFDIALDNVEYDGDYIWRRYDGASRSRRQGGWQDLAEGTTTLEKGRGYIFQGSVTGDLVLNVGSPTFETEDLNTNLEIHTSDNTQDANWNFIGNPYTAYVDINSTVYDSPITVWTGNGYESYRPGDDDYNFHPYQAFFVQTPNGVDNIGFTAEGRNTYDGAQTAVAKAKSRRAKSKVNPNRLLINLELTAEGADTYTDKTRVVFNDATSADYELACDASKLLSAERSAEIYSIDKNGVEYSINERPVAEGTVKLGIQVNKAGTYTISASRMDTNVLLKDHATGDIHDLSLGGYEFTAPAGTLNDRFSLIMISEPTSIEQLMTKTGIAVSTRGGIAVSNLADGTKASVYDMSGACIADSIGSAVVTLANGNYILKVGNLAAKVMVK